LMSAELEDAASLRDVATVVQRGEMVNRIAEEIETMIVELGVDARLLRLQLDETYNEVEDELDDVIADYLGPGRNPDDTLAELGRLRDDDVLDARTTLVTLHLGDADLDDEIAPKGLRLLHRVHKLSPELAQKIANQFGGLPRLQRVTVDELMAVDGVDSETAETVKDTLDRVTENTILDQYS
jgi:diadenylate cyclase